MTPRNARHYLKPGDTAKTREGDVRVVEVVDGGKFVLCVKDGELVHLSSKGMIPARRVSTTERSLGMLTQLIGKATS